MSKEKCVIPAPPKHSMSLSLHLYYISIVFLHLPELRRNVCYRLSLPHPAPQSWTEIFTSKVMSLEV